MRTRLLQLPTVIALLLLVVALPGLTQSTGDSVDLTTSPSTDGSPIDVTLGCYVNDIMAINDATQTMTVDFFAVMAWRDARWVGETRRQVDLSQLWHPRVQVLNELRLFPKMDRKVDTQPDGTISYVQRFIGDKGPPCSCSWP